MSQSFSSNPFCTRFVRPSSVEYRFEQSDSQFELQELVRRLVQCRQGLIVGPHGSGKTTLIHSLLPILHQEMTVSHVQLSASARLSSLEGLRHQHRMALAVGSQMAALANAHRFGRSVLVIDGAEQLSRLARWCLLRRAREQELFVLMTSHKPLGQHTVLFRTQVSEGLIRSLATDLLAETPDQIRQVVNRQLLERDLTKLSNVRELWFDLYDIVQDESGKSMRTSSDPNSIVQA